MEATQHKCRMNNRVESQITTISLSSNLMKARKGIQNSEITSTGNTSTQHIKTLSKKGPVTVVVAETLLEF